MAHVRKLLVLALLVLGGLAVANGADLGGLGIGGAQSERGRVTRIVDGDTIVVRDETVRLIGIDTPETKKPNTPVQCFGKAATAETTRLIDRKRVRLEFDVERRDRYGRQLAYVYRRSDGMFLNAELVRRGYATASPYPPNVRYERRFHRLAREAREAGRGLWSACR